MIFISFLGMKLDAKVWNLLSDLPLLINRRREVWGWNLFRRNLSLHEAPEIRSNRNGAWQSR